jgi:hypothetical protein
MPTSRSGLRLPRTNDGSSNSASIMSSKEAARDNSARRRREDITFAAFIGTPLTGLVFAAGLSVWTTDTETRQFAHNLISLIFGGILGGLTGYFTGRSTRSS